MRRHLDNMIFFLQTRQKKSKIASSYQNSRISLASLVREKNNALKSRMISTFLPSSRAALEHKKSLGQRKIGHNAHASTKGAGAFYAIADNAAVWKPAFIE